VQHRVAELFGEREARSPRVAQRGDRERPQQAGPQPWPTASITETNSSSVLAA
jgi:hypothetical protein